MRSTFFKTALSVLFIQSTFAANAPAPLSECPSISAIKTAGFNMAEYQAGDWYAGNTKNNYGTDHEWSFYIRASGATNADEASTKGLAAVDLLTTHFGPIKDVNKTGADEWSCAYFGEDADYKYLAFSITPAINISAIPAKFNRLILM